MIRVAVVTISDSVVAGTREDRSGAALADKVAEFGWVVAYKKVVSDDEERISSILADLTDVDVILTTGGTGVALRDVTPEATAAVSDRKIDGFGELMRLKGMEKTRFAHLSRGGAFTRGEVLIVNLPGSPKGCGRVVRGGGGIDSARRRLATREDGASCVTLRALTAFLLAALCVGHTVVERAQDKSRDPSAMTPGKDIIGLLRRTSS